MDQRSDIVRALWRLSILPCLALLVSPQAGHSQTTSITSSGLNTTVTVNGAAPVPTYDITGGTRPGNGTNLFHSFGQFSVGTNDVARFANDSGLPTSNILSRVTGGQPSNIYGNISTTGFTGANLYLINPAGVLFGPTASLNVSGSVTVSTADYLRLADGLRFNAIPGPQDALLSQAPVVAFGFLNPHPRPITLRGATLYTHEASPTANEPHRSLSFVGGNINLSEANVKAAGGVQLISVASPGEVRADTVPTGIASPALGTIRMTNAEVNTSDPSFANRASGPVVLRGGRLVMDHSTITAQLNTDAGSPTFTSFGSPITIQMTENIRANDSHIVTHGGGFTIGTVSLEAGKAIRLTNTTVDAGINVGDPGLRAGSVALSAPLVSLDGSHVGSTGAMPGRLINAPGGSITIQANQVRLQNGSELSVAGRSSGLPPTNGGGNIVINANTVRVDHSRIDASSVSGDGGNISVTAKDAVRLNEATIVADGEPFTSRAPGNGGNIVIDAGKSYVSQTSTISAESVGERGGNVVIQASERIRIDGGLISTNAGGSGSGGTISMSADVVRLRDGAQVESTAVSGPGGNVSIDANDFRKVNSTIDVTSQSGPNGTVTLP